MDTIFQSVLDSIGIPLYLFIFVLVWSLFWKAIALWKAARKNSPIWFVLFLLVHTLGILEILYIFLFSEISLDEKKKKRRNKK